MFVCNYDRKKSVDDYKQKYVEITKKCLWIEIADERLRFLQTKHLQCTFIYRESPLPANFRGKDKSAGTEY